MNPEAEQETVRWLGRLGQIAGGETLELPDWRQAVDEQNSLDALTRIMRDLWFIRLGIASGEGRMLASGHEEELNRLAGSFDDQWILQVLDAIAATREGLDQSLQPRLVMDRLFFALEGGAS